MSVISSRERLKCDACGMTSTTNPRFALLLDNWTTCYSEHLCGACTVINLMISLMQIIKGQPDCGTAMRNQLESTFVWDVVPDEWYTKLNEGRHFIMQILRAVPPRN